MQLYSVIYYKTNIHRELSYKQVYDTIKWYTDIRTYKPCYVDSFKTKYLARSVQHFIRFMFHKMAPFCQVSINNNPTCACEYIYIGEVNEVALESTSMNHIRYVL